MTLPDALQPKKLLHPCAACNGDMYTCFVTWGDVAPYSLRSGVKMMRTLWRFAYCEDCKATMQDTAVLQRKRRIDPPIDPKIVRILQMMKRGGWDPWKPPPVSL